MALTLRGQRRSAEPVNSDGHPCGVDAEDPGQVAAVLRDHAMPLLDYCRRLLGDPSAAASVTQTALVAAQAVLQDPGTIRAWLIGLAREQILRDGPQQARVDGTTWPYGPEQWAGAELEALDLVHEHGIPPRHLPAILGISRESLPDLLACTGAQPVAVAAVQMDSPQGSGIKTLAGVCTPARAPATRHGAARGPFRYRRLRRRGRHSAGASWRRTVSRRPARTDSAAGR